MKVLVTGGAGFVGSHLVDRLVQEGHEVVVWDAFTTGRKENINKKARCHVIFCQNIQPEYHNESKYDIIYHLGGEARIQPSFRRPELVHDANVTGTLKMLELARRQGGRLVYAGSSSVYHDMYANPYSFSKQIAEHYCTMYHRIYRVPVAIARFFNVYGPRQLEDGPYATVVGIFDRQKRLGLPLTVTGDGEQRRDFTHVDDIVDGLVAMGASDFPATVFNLGTGRNHSINEVAALYQQPVEYIEKRPGEAQTTLADIAEAQTKLGYSPKKRLEEYVQQVLADCQGSVEPVSEHE